MCEKYYRTAARCCYGTSVTFAPHPLSPSFNARFFRAGSYRRSCRDDAFANGDGEAATATLAKNMNQLGLHANASPSLPGPDLGEAFATRYGLFRFSA